MSSHQCIFCKDDPNDWTQYPDVDGELGDVVCSDCIEKIVVPVALNFMASKSGEKLEGLPLETRWFDRMKLLEDRHQVASAILAGKFDEVVHLVRHATDLNHALRDFVARRKVSDV